MAAPSIVLDGSMAYGEQPVTINAVVYAVNSSEVTPNINSAEDETVTGTPNRKRWTKSRYGLTMELQLATSATTYPKFGDTFTRTVNSESGALNFIVIEVSEPKSNSSGDIRVVNITAEQAIGAVTTVA